MGDSFAEIEAALAAAASDLPGLLSALVPFIPQLGVVTPFLNLLPVAIQAVQTVQAATGGTVAASTAAVAQHLTPGAPNAPALAPTAGASV